MKKKVFFSFVVLLVIISTLLAACSSTSSTISSSTSTSSNFTTGQVVTEAITTVANTTTSAKTATSGANWWDKFGEPQYGGSLTIATTSNINNAFDPYNWMSAGTYMWYEALWMPDWTLDRNTFNFYHMWVPDQYWTGNMAETWEWNDAQTLTVHLRHDIYWQDKAPVNGRQFVASDIVYHFNRMFGTGDGFTDPNPLFIGRFDQCESVTAPDDFTVVFKFKAPTTVINIWSIIPEPILQFYESRDVIAMDATVSQTTSTTSTGQASSSGGGAPGGGATLSNLSPSLNDWHNVVGTGPFMLTDFVAASSITQSKNPTYWAYDQRHLENRLPYVDEVKMLYISDTSTSIAALRTGKIDLMTGVNFQQEETLKKTNPDMQEGMYSSGGSSLGIRVDKAPFNDIKVRKALQLALDLPSIASGLYQSKVDWKPVGFISPDYTGYGLAYDKWPADLQEEYTYNPEKAKQLLTEAGYPDGFTAKCYMASGSSTEWILIAKDMLQSIGVTLEIDASMDQFALSNFMMAKKHEGLNLGGLGDDMPPTMGMRMALSTEQTNYMCNNDHVFDKMVADTLSATDTDEVKKKVNEVNMYMLRAHWSALGFPLGAYTMWQPYLKGYSGEKIEWGRSMWYARFFIDVELKESLGR